MKKRGLIYLWILLLISLIQLSSGQDVYATTSAQAYGDSFVSSDLEIPRRWEMSITGTTITAIVYDDVGIDGAETLLEVLDEDDFLKWGKISSGKSILSLDISELKDGSYTLRLYEDVLAKYGDITGSMYPLGDLKIEITGGTPIFCFSEGESEKTFLDSFSS